MKFAKKIILAAILFSLIFYPKNSFSQRKMRNIHRKKLTHIAEKHTKLNLSDEQKDKIADLRIEFKKESLPIQAKLRNKKAELKVLLLEKEPNFNEVNETVDKIAKLRAELIKLKIKHKFRISSLLTPEQQKIFEAKKMVEKKKRLGEKRGFITRYR